MGMEMLQESQAIQIEGYINQSGWLIIIKKNSLGYSIQLNEENK